jgi:hypothetical protein
LLYFSPIVGEGFVDRFFRVSQFSINAITALGNEMFRLTDKTRGGFLLMLVFFYVAFVFGVAFFVEAGAEAWAAAACGSAGACMFTMMRLSFFDGGGLDFSYGLSTSGHQYLFFLSIVYLCVTAFGILNGLIGIFGDVFNKASMKAFEGESPPADRVSKVFSMDSTYSKALSRKDSVFIRVDNQIGSFDRNDSLSSISPPTEHLSVGKNTHYHHYSGIGAGTGSVNKNAPQPPLPPPNNDQCYSDLIRMEKELTKIKFHISLLLNECRSKLDPADISVEA